MSLAILKKKLADRYDHTHGMVGIYTNVQDQFGATKTPVLTTTPMVLITQE